MVRADTYWKVVVVRDGILPLGRLGRKEYAKDHVPHRPINLPNPPRLSWA